MRRTIRSVVRKLPEFGLALHGKPVMYLEHIAQHGLKPYRREEVYFCPLPPRKVSKLSESEVLERTIGSILHATSWAVRGNLADPKSPDGHLPAVLILRGNEHNSFLGSYHEHERHTRLLTHPDKLQLLGSKGYRSFGVHTADHIPPEQLAAVVRITKAEHSRILKKVGQNSSAVHGEIQRIMVFKTLRKLRAVVRKINKEKKKSRQPEFEF